MGIRLPKNATLGDLIAAVTDEVSRLTQRVSQYQHPCVVHRQGLTSQAKSPTGNPKNAKSCLAHATHENAAHIAEIEAMQMNVALQPVVALIAGILILMIPRLLNYIVAIYLIVIGILGLVRM